VNAQKTMIFMPKTKFVVMFFGDLKFIPYLCDINLKQIRPMRKDNLLYRVFDLYYDGFRHMTLGKTLWAIILIKLFVIFAILKVFFFPDFIGQHAEEGEEASFVASEMMERSAPTPNNIKQPQ
jgi:hypothetical protein